MGRIWEDVCKQIRKDFEAATHGDGTAERWADKLNCSVPAVYRAAQRAGWRSGRKQRKDYGSSTTGITEEYLLLVARAIKRSSRTFGTETRPIMYIETAIKEVKRAHRLSVSASPATVARHLRNLRLDKQGIVSVVPYSWLRSTGPNHTHLVDASLCINYQFKETGMVFDFFEKNKFEKTVKFKSRVQRYVLVDHYTGAFYIEYFLAQGERRADYIDFLNRAWSLKDDEGYPFCGMPKILYTDKSSALASLTDYFASFDVELLIHERGNPRAKGAVENWMKHIEGYFESTLYENPPKHLRDLNERAFEWSRDFQANRKHTRYHKTRFDFFVEKMPDIGLNLPPDLKIMRELAHRAPDERKVADGYIKWNNRFIFIGDFAPHGATVQVLVNLWDSSKVRIRFEDEVFDTSVPEKNEAGQYLDAALIGEEFKRKPDPISVKLMKLAENLPEGQKGSMEFGKTKEYKLVKGKQFSAEAPDPFVHRQTFFTWANKKLGRPLTAAEHNLVRRNYPFQVRKSTFPEMLAFIRAEIEEIKE